MLISKLWQLFQSERSVALSASTVDRIYAQVAKHLDLNPYKEAEQLRPAAVWQLQQVEYPKVNLRVVGYMKTMAEWAASPDVALLERNPIKTLKLPKAPQREEVVVIPAAEQDEVFYALKKISTRGSRWDLVSVFLYQAMLRTCEAFGLQWQDVDWQEHRARVHQNMTIGHGLSPRTKTGKERWVPLNEAAMKVLRKLGERGPEEFIFPYNRHSYMWAFRTAMQRLKADGKISRIYRPYDLRHSSISALLEKGIPVSQVATWAGNSPEICWKHYAATTQHYEMPVL